MIAILLATYNSDRFIREQIDSILNQTNTEWVVYIHDDGSKDNTVSIIKDYQKCYPSKFIFVHNTATALGACNSFIALQEEVVSEYYMFCDHDDVWLPDKLEISMQAMRICEEKFPNTPIIIHTDMKVVDVNLKTISGSFWDYMKLKPDHCSFIELAVCNCVNGCTILFNNSANRIALRNKANAIMHDTLISQSVASVGGIIYPIYKPTVLYRQTGQNVLGAHRFNIKKYFLKLLGIGTTIKNIHKQWSSANQIKPINILSFLYVKLYMFYLRLFKS